MILSTIQTQDFADIPGDMSRGRITFPIYAPRVSRLATLIMMVSWSIFLSTYWGIEWEYASILIALGTMTGARFFLLRTVESDKASYFLYSVGPFFSFCMHCRSDSSPQQVWLTFAHVLPLQKRFDTFRS